MFSMSFQEQNAATSMHTKLTFCCCCVGVKAEF